MKQMGSIQSRIQNVEYDFTDAMPLLAGESEVWVRADNTDSFLPTSSSAPSA